MNEYGTAPEGETLQGFERRMGWPSGFEPTETDLSGPAYLALSDAAARLWLRAAHWCSVNRSGTITPTLLRSWLSTKKAASELEAAGFWTTNGEDWMVPERGETIATKRARAGRLGGLAKASKPPSKPLANGLAKPEFASGVPAGLVLPLASPSPSPLSLNSESSSESPSFQLSSIGPEPSPARAPKRRMRRCPEAFELDETGKKMCAEYRVDWAVEGPKFRDWEFKDPKSDWQATARNWIRKAAADGSRTPAPMRYGRPVEVSPNVDYDTRAALASSRRVQEFLAGAK